MFRVKEVFPELDAGCTWILIQDDDARLFLADFCTLTGDVHLRPLDEPWKKVHLDLATSDQLRWKLLAALGRVRPASLPFIPDTGFLQGDANVLPPRAGQGT